MMLFGTRGWVDVLCVGLGLMAVGIFGFFPSISLYLIVSGVGVILFACVFKCWVAYEASTAVAELKRKVDELTGEERPKTRLLQHAREAHLKKATDCLTNAQHSMRVRQWEHAHSWAVRGGQWIKDHHEFTVKESEVLSAVRVR